MVEHILEYDVHIACDIINIFSTFESAMTVDLDIKSKQKVPSVHK